MGSLVRTLLAVILCCVFLQPVFAWQRRQNFLLLPGIEPRFICSQSVPSLTNTSRLTAMINAAELPPRSVEQTCYTEVQTGGNVAESCLVGVLIIAFKGLEVKHTKRPLVDSQQARQVISLTCVTPSLHELLGRDSCLCRQYGNV
jgi:hypothetical protein